MLIDHHDHQVKRLGFDLKRPVEIMFIFWHKYQSGSISWETFQSDRQPIRNDVNHLLLRGVFSGNKRLIRMCRELYNHREWLWTLIEVQRIEPTNNTAERARRDRPQALLRNSERNLPPPEAISLPVAHRRRRSNPS